MFTARPLLDIIIIAALFSIAVYFLRKKKPAPAKISQEEIERRFTEDIANLKKEMKTCISRSYWLKLEIEIDTFQWYYQNRIEDRRLDKACVELYTTWYQQEQRLRPTAQSN